MFADTLLFIYDSFLIENIYYNQACCIGKILRILRLGRKKWGPKLMSESFIKFPLFNILRNAINDQNIEKWIGGTVCITVQLAARLD